MRYVVRQNFVKWNAPLEGVLPFMYTDALGLVTTGMGDLIDSPGAAQTLPWKNPDGSLADAATVAAQWQAVKDGPVNSSSGAGYLTTIRLDADGIQATVDRTIATNEPILREGFPAYDDWNAYAQMMLWSMDWAMGSGFWRSFPQFTAAMNASPPRFAAAAPAKFVDTSGKTVSNPGGENLGAFRGVGVQRRITEDYMLAVYAQKVQDAGGDPDEFNWPGGPSGGLFGSLDRTVVTGVLSVVAGAAALDPDRAMALGRSAWKVVRSWVG